jgi:hypothetical protein
MAMASARWPYALYCRSGGRPDGLGDVLMSQKSDTLMTSQKSNTQMRLSSTQKVLKKLASQIVSCPLNRRSENARVKAVIICIKAASGGCLWYPPLTTALLARRRIDFTDPLRWLRDRGKSGAIACRTSNFSRLRRWLFHLKASGHLNWSL